MINKPCPFCGGEPFFMDNDGWYWVVLGSLQKMWG